MAGLFFSQYRGVRSRSLTTCGGSLLGCHVSQMQIAESPIDRSSGGRAKESDQNQIRSASRSRHSLFTRRMHHQPQPPAPASFQDIHRDPTLEKYVKAFKHCLSFFSVDRISTSSMLHVTPYYSLFNVIIDHGTFFKILPHEKITTVF